jgi:hypothetical protein
MCGIIGIISSKPVALPLLSGLKRLEYLRKGINARRFNCETQQRN